jgi:hypothetical protein
MVQESQNTVFNNAMVPGRLVPAVLILIPLLWLVASLNTLGDSVPSPDRRPSASAISTGGHGGQDFGAFACSSEQSIRRWSRRLNETSGTIGFTPVPTLSGYLLLLPDHVSDASGFLHLSLVFGNSWQFHWRTALEPRAPSIIS